MKKILISTLLAAIAIVSFIGYDKNVFGAAPTGDTLDAFKITSTSTITPRNASNTFQIPKLANLNCIGTNGSGTFGTGTCTGGGGGGTTTINGTAASSFSITGDNSNVTTTVSGTSTIFSLIIPAQGELYATGSVIRASTGTANNFSYWDPSGTFIRPTSSIVANGANIGVGNITNAANLLTIRPTGISTNPFVIRDASNTTDLVYMHLNSAGNAEFNFNNAAGTTDIQLRSGGLTSYIRVGALGIGNSAPANTLDVSGGGDFSVLAVGTTTTSTATAFINGTFNANGAITFGALGSTGTPCVTVGSAGLLATSTCGSIGTSTAVAAGYFPFWGSASQLTGTSSAFQSSTGNIGFGTINPGGFIVIATGTSDTALLGTTAGATSNAQLNIAPSSDNIIRWGMRLDATNRDLNWDYRTLAGGVATLWDWSRMGFAWLKPTPPVQATTSLLALGPNLINNGSASGTFIGANPSTGYNGDFVNLQVNSSSIFRTASSGATSIGTSTIINSTLNLGTFGLNSGQLYIAGQPVPFANPIVINGVTPPNFIYIDSTFNAFRIGTQSGAVKEIDFELPGGSGYNDVMSLSTTTLKPSDAFDNILALGTATDRWKSLFIGTGVATFQGNISTTIASAPFLGTGSNGVIAAVTTSTLGTYITQLGYATGTIGGNGTSTWIPFYCGTTTLCSNSNHTFNSSTLVMTAASATFSGRIAVNGASLSGNSIESIANGAIQGLRVQGTAASDISFSTFVSGDNSLRFNFSPAGVMAWGNGAVSADTNLYRSATGTLTTDQSFKVTQFLTLGASSTITTPVIGGAIVSGGCDSATSSIDISVVTSSNPGFITSPNNDPGTTLGGTWSYSFLSAPGVLTTRVCSNVSVTPNSTTYTVKIIK